MEVIGCESPKLRRVIFFVVYWRKNIDIVRDKFGTASASDTWDA